MSARRVLITGITGQIGHYLGKQLASQGCKVFGVVRRAGGSSGATENAFFTPLSADLLDECSLGSAIDTAQPDEIYNLAGQSFVPTSWQQPMLTAQYTALGPVRILEAIRRQAPKVRFVQAGSSELFAGAKTSPQDERTPVTPRNPYGAAKAFAHHMVRAYRNEYGLQASNVIYYTNESPRRPRDFLFRKVTWGAALAAQDKTAQLVLGNLDVIRDWGYAPDYADATARVASEAPPDDYVVATGVGHTVRELVNRAFELVGLDAAAHVRSDPAFTRSAEPAPLVGNAEKLRAATGWTPRTSFDRLVRIMLAHDLAELGVDMPPPLRDQLHQLSGVT